MFYVPRTQQITSARPFASANLSGANFVSERDFTQPEIETVQVHEVLFALSDPTRLAIARALGDGEEHSAGDLAGDVPKSTLSHHLKILREAGITSTRPEGMRCRVSLRRVELNRRFPGLLAAILKNAEA
jgi:DNA-binding transcriptional ArsR family regulator